MDGALGIHGQTTEKRGKGLKGSLDVAGGPQVGKAGQIFREVLQGSPKVGNAHAQGCRAPSIPSRSPTRRNGVLTMQPVTVQRPSSQGRLHTHF
jgi:hypothetical protein